MYESVFFQTLEYVIAPIALMMILFYVKHMDRKVVQRPRFIENGVESMFIVMYSNLLFFFSLMGHPDPGPIAEQAKIAALLMAFIGLLFNIVVKYHAGIIGEAHREAKVMSNGGALVLMVCLFFNICYYNFHGWHIDVDFIHHPFDYLRHHFAFLLHPGNAVLAVGSGLLVWLVVKMVRGKGGLSENMNNLLAVALEDAPTVTDKLKILKERIDNDSLPSFVRLNALLDRAQLFMDAGGAANLDAAEGDLERAKAICVLDGIDGETLQSVRRLRVQLFRRTNRTGQADSEVRELVNEMNATDNAEVKQVLQDWIEELKA
jgi:hypothetical protein